MKLAKPIMYCQPETKPSGKSKSLMERGLSPKCGRQLLVSRQPHATAQCGPYQDVWTQKQAPTQQPYYWPTDVLLINGFNQSPSSCSEWNSVTPTVRRPLTRQSSLESASKSSYTQESDCSNFHSCLYRQLITSSQQNLRRSVDSGLYSDPDGRRPISSDGSTGSAHSSFSMSAGSCISNWDSSTDSMISTTTGSANNSCAVSWDRSLSNETDFDYLDSGSHLLFKKESQPSGSHSLWHMEDQKTCLSTDKNGIWSTRFKSPEDYQLIDDLFMKESGTKPTSNACQDVNITFNSLSLSRDGEVSRKNFDRAVQPPQARITQQGSLNPSNFRKGF